MDPGLEGFCKRKPWIFSTGRLSPVAFL